MINKVFGAYIVLVLISFVIVQLSAPQIQSNLTSFWGILMFFGTQIICIVFPLVMMYELKLKFLKREAKKSSSSRSSLERTVSNLSTWEDEPSLEKIFEEGRGELLETFRVFLARRFKVQMLYFLIDVNSYTHIF